MNVLSLSLHILRLLLLAEAFKLSSYNMYLNTLSLTCLYPCSLCTECIFFLFDELLYLGQGWHCMAYLQGIPYLASLLCPLIFFYSFCCEPSVSIQPNLSNEHSVSDICKTQPLQEHCVMTEPLSIPCTESEIRI